MGHSAPASPGDHGIGRSGRPIHEGTPRMRRFVTAATSLCLLFAGAPSPAHAAENSPPVAVDDPACLQPPGVFGGSYPIPEDWHDWSVLGIGCGPLVNDSDPDGDPLSVELVGQPAHGEAAVIENDPTDWLQYRPAKDYSTPGGDQPDGNWLSDSITYRAFDGQAHSNEAKLSDLGLAGQRPAELHSRTAADRDPRRRRARSQSHGRRTSRPGRRTRATSRSRSRSWLRPPTSSPTRPPSTRTGS